MLVLSVVSSRFPYMSILISGGYSDGAPPLPIPNREVKPVRADGTASSGRVGSRRFFPEESGIPHNVECRISYLYDPHEGWPCRSEREEPYIRSSSQGRSECLYLGSPDKHRGLGIHPCRSERVGLYILWYI